MANVLLIVGCILAATAWSSMDGVEGAATDRGWVKMNTKHLVCFQAKGNQFGNFSNLFMSGLVGAIKLVHRSGWVRCGIGEQYNSRWGCANRASALNLANVVGTDQNNHILFPRKDLFVPRHKAGNWYYLPFTNTATTSELVFADLGRPFYFPYGQQMRIWYGEDLAGWTESDNAGRACVDVYAKFVLNHGTDINAV